MKTKTSESKTNSCVVAYNNYIDFIIVIYNILISSIIILLKKKKLINDDLVIFINFLFFDSNFILIKI